MASVVLQKVTKQFGPQVVLADVSLEIRTGETVGLVGANGVGKTTLFRLIAGLQAPDLGTATATRGLEIGMLAQEPQLDSDRTLHDEVGRAFDELLELERRLLDLSHRMAEEHDRDHLPELMGQYDRLNARFEAAGGYGFETRMNEILGGLGFTEADHALAVSALSGGQKCRAALAKLLLQDRQLLLLDEPTNHLDIDATRWLEKFLAGHRGGAVIISHDRYLLDRLVSKIIEVENRGVTVYPGNYTNYVGAKEVRRLTLQRQHEKDQAFVEKERAFIAKHIARQRSKEARGRRTRLDRRIAAGEFVLDSPERQRQASFKFGQATAKGGNPVVTAKDLAKRYDDKELFAELSFQVMPGDRIGITGPNGTGKTTLLRMMMDQVRPDAGSVALASNLSVGYYDQEHAGLDRCRTLIEEVHEARPDLTETEVRSFLGRFLFTKAEVFKTIGQMSGGEQSRMRLARLVLAQPQMLILDEPTNHLDIPSREMLESALGQYGGTLIVVSHDRYFLDRVIERLLILERGEHTLYNGNYSYYAEQLDRQRQAAQQKKSADKPRSSNRRRRPRVESSDSSAPHRQYDGLAIRELEDRIIAREEELSAVQAQFGDEAVYRNPEAAADLQTQLRVLVDELASLNKAWDERADAQGK